MERLTSNHTGRPTVHVLRLPLFDAEIVCAGEGDKAEAIRCFNKSLEFNPQNIHAQEMLKKLENK